MDSSVIFVEESQGAMDIIEIDSADEADESSILELQLIPSRNIRNRCLRNARTMNVDIGLKLQKENLRRSSHIQNSDIANRKSSRRSKSVEKVERFSCSICFDSWERSCAPLTATICGHIFCSFCINGAYQSSRKCPLCNKLLKKTDLILLYV